MSESHSTSQHLRAAHTPENNPDHPDFLLRAQYRPFFLSANKPFFRPSDGRASFSRVARQLERRLVLGAQTTFSSRWVLTAPPGARLEFVSASSQNASRVLPRHAGIVVRVGKSRLQDRELGADAVSKCPVLVGACAALSSWSSFSAALADAALACRSGRLPAPAPRKHQFNPPRLHKRQSRPPRRRAPAHVGSRHPRSTSRLANGRLRRRS